MALLQRFRHPIEPPSGTGMIPSVRFEGQMNARCLGAACCRTCPSDGVYLSHSAPMRSRAASIVWRCLSSLPEWIWTRADPPGSTAESPLRDGVQGQPHDGAQMPR